MPAQETPRAQIVRLYRAQQFALAAEAAHSYLEQSPGERQVLQILADASLGAGYLDVAEQVFGHLVADGGTAFDLAGLANVHSARGNMARAGDLIRQAMALDPTLPRVWSLLSGIHRFRHNDPLIAKAKRLLRTDLTPASRRAMLYALSSAMDAAGRPEKAWDMATRAAAVEPPEYYPDDLDRWATDMVPAFDQAFLAPRTGRGDPTQAPVFIVGMPRSGTTLVESVLAASGQVTPMGELPTIPLITERAILDDMARGHAHSKHGWVRRWRDQAFGEAAEYYLSDIRRRAGGQMPRRFTDKLPGNIFYLGQIACMFPNARIVRMHRDPLDTCASCYLGQFAEGHQYTARPDWLAAAWRSFQRAGDQMVPMLPNPVLDVVYEDLVREPEAQIRRMLGFLGLAWSPACLTPGAGYATTTRSIGQVRNAINDRSVGRWRRYGDRIELLAQALGIEVEAVRQAPA